MQCCCRVVGYMRWCSCILIYWIGRNSNLRAGLIRIKLCLVLIVCSSPFAALSDSTFVSDAVFGSSVLSERRLLQAKKPCPVNWEFKNCTIITSKCKGPRYPPNLCCSACPFAEFADDLSTDCSNTMFGYITANGKYPPGLFASECRKGRKGLEFFTVKEEP